MTDEIGPGPWKCRKCNIIFTDRDRMFDHLRDTGYYKSDEGYISRGTTWFHDIVDIDGDNIMNPKKRYN